MRVAIDARELRGRPTGVGRYLAGLLGAWSANDAARRHHWTLVAPTPLKTATNWLASVTIAPGSGGTFWEQVTLPRALGAARPDVVFAPGYTAPLTVAAPLVLTIHDVSFFAHPEWFAFREGARRRLLTAWSARRARNGHHRYRVFEARDSLPHRHRRGANQGDSARHFAGSSERSP